MPLFFIVFLLWAAIPGHAATPISIAPLNRAKPVDFEAEILPFLKQSCLACHNQTKAKADLILETPQTILKGGESGPAVVPGKPQESLLLQVSSHQQKPFMPPAENKANAPNLTPEQLALLQLWIEQGATGEVRGQQTVAWRPLASRVRPILSLSLTEDAQFAACGRGNELYIYQLPTRRAFGPLADPELRKSNSTNAPAHLDLIESLDFSPDGELLVSGSYREVKLWRRQHNVHASGDVPDALPRALKTAKTVGISSNGGQLALATKSNLQTWDLLRNKVEHEHALDALPSALAWSADNEHVITAAGTNIYLWSPDLATNQILFASEPVTLLAASSNCVVSATRAGFVQIWPLPKGAPMLLTNLAQSAVSALSISSDGTKLAIGAPGHSPVLLTLADQKKVELKTDYRLSSSFARVEHAITRASNHLSYRRTVLDNVEKERTSQIDRVRKAGDSVGIAQKAAAEQQKQVAAARGEENLIQKELTGLQSRLKQAQEASDQALAELTKGRAAVKVASPDSLEAKLDDLTARAAAAALATNSLAILKPEAEKNEKATQEKLKAVQKKISDADALFKRHQITNAAAENELQFAISAAQAAADNLTVAQNHLQFAESARKQLDAQLETIRPALTNSALNVVALAFSPDGSLLAGAGENGLITLWSADSGAPLDNISPASPGPVLGVAFRQDGALLTWNSERAEAWDIAPSWRMERVITTANAQPAFADRVNAISFSPDGLYFATGGGEPTRSGEIKIWRTRDGQLEHDLKNIHSDTVLALAYSPDGRYLASGGADRFAKITEVATGKVLRALEGHTHHVLSLTWKADGHTLVTGSADNLAKVWDAFSGEKKKGPEPFGKEVTSVSYLGDSDRLAVSSGDATLRIIKDNGEKVRSLEGCATFIQACRASTDGLLVLAGGEDGVLRVWRADETKPIAQFGP